ncbi:MAG TPA: hypothetical protein VMG40_00815 [Bryobacteraceae bacterium]|nr:hypothetical protein [Bryobacteraceae bacterium]
MDTMFTPDRRSSPRSRRSGKVQLRFEAPAPTLVTAELVETSGTGFRASHSSSELVAGLNVEFQHGAEVGRARVIWTHIQGGKRVSGFLII